MKSKISSVIFDADNTLWTLNSRIMKSLLVRELHIPYSKEYSEQFDNLFKNIWSFLICRQTFLCVTEATIMDAIAFHIRFVDPITFFKAYKKCTMDSSVISIKPEALEVVKQLYQRGYRLFVKSNNLVEIQKKRLDELGFSPYLEQILCCDNSFVKPDPRSIIPLINNQDPSSFIIIGDGLKADIRLANLMSIDSIWLNEDGKKNIYPIFPTFEVSNLTQTLDYLPDLRLV